VNPLRVKNWITSELEASLVLYYTGQSRASGAIIQRQIDNMESHESRSTEVLMAMKEQTYRIKEALLKGNIRRFADILNEGWAAKKKLADEITNPAVDEAYQVAMKNGAYAGKISGAGGGGFFTLVVDPVRRVELVSALSSLPGQTMPVHFSSIGTQSWRLP
jgi:D-glycero-alpha-D-manno-heptose-7-phosphate kinase